MRLKRGMSCRMVKMDDNKKLKVIFINCKSQSCAGNGICKSVELWIPQPPKLA
jgi:hypothetical protein